MKAFCYSLHIAVHIFRKQFIISNKATVSAILKLFGPWKLREIKKAYYVSQTLFLRMISDALSRDWMQADKAS